MPDKASIEVVPMDAPIGAEIVGADLSRPLEGDAFARIDAAYSRYGVLIFRDQSVTEQQLVDFTRRFGEVERYVLNDYALPDHPEILLVSNILENGRNIGLADAGATWHTDMSYIAAPPRGTLLYAREVPVMNGRVLGDTLFASAAAAYDDLPDDLKTLLDGRRTVHSYEAKHARRASVGKSNRKPITQAQRESLPPVEHPVIRRHPVTGRKCVYVVAGECESISGLPDEQAAALLEELAERCTREAYQYRHQWRARDLVMWDNCLVQHLAIQDYALPQRRLMWRTTVKGTVPV